MGACATAVAGRFGLSPARVSQLRRRYEGLWRTFQGEWAGRRAAVFDESLELIRLLLTQQTVSFTGEFFSVDGAGVGPLPAKPLDIWLGGSAPSGLPEPAREAKHFHSRVPLV